MPVTPEKIAALTDQQALRVVEKLSADFASDETPETRAEQQAALHEFFREAGGDVDLSSAAKADAAAAADAARQLITLLAAVPELAPEVERMVDHPPTQEAAAVPLILAVPVVFTGCIVLLQVAAQTEFKRNEDGTWKVHYDPSKPTTLGKAIKDIAADLKAIMTKLH